MLMFIRHSMKLPTLITGYQFPPRHQSQALCIFKSVGSVICRAELGATFSAYLPVSGYTCPKNIYSYHFADLNYGLNSTIVQKIAQGKVSSCFFRLRNTRSYHVILFILNVFSFLLKQSTFGLALMRRIILHYSNFIQVQTRIIFFC